MDVLKAHRKRQFQEMMTFANLWEGLENALLQAEASAKDVRLPVVVLHQDGQRYTGSLVILRLEDFSKYLKRKEQHDE
jgi:carbamoylphosphate synthase large subunit